ncbi:hypothetical protein BCR43DRAFT_547064 [Syncephalastrum racemosum]|uniref:Dolichyl-phosphate-mannose--protein mannosyltransferase n=1 Tax=Syncephalastrum racemosum TaxID=13706 RepID=A0A1X2HCR8_SYNRA|nr:hypothetical protein BCR43DRAFT_547064 [Syncephalastrum racemosum]
MVFSLRYRRTVPKTASSTASPFLYYDQRKDIHQNENSDQEAEHKARDRGPKAKSTAWFDTAQLLLSTMLALVVRLWSLGSPSTVITSEIALCKQVNWYLQHKFFIGAFPPLGGLFYATIAWFLGYDGAEEILYAGQHMASFPLQKLRLASAVTGTLVIPVGYLTIRSLGYSRAASTLIAGLLILENGFVTQSKFVLPDPLLCFFSSLTAMIWAVQLRAEKPSWRCQIFTGLCIGCAMSIKWQGILSMAVVWLSNGLQFWEKLGDKRNSARALAIDFMKRVITAAIVPVCVYFAFFQLHFGLIPNSGDHDLLISPQLKYFLNGNEFEPTQRDIAYGSHLVLRHEGTSGGYLHSHLKRYTTGSTQQEVTLYPYADLNNVWIIHKAGQQWNSSQPIEYVKNNDAVMFEHYATTRRLHSHDHRPPMSNKKEHHEVTAYGDYLIQDPHDHWWVRTVMPDGKIDTHNFDVLQALKTKFRLLHTRGCYLLSHNAIIPGENINQQEVTCMTSAKKTLSTWTVESVYHEQLDGANPLVTYEPPSLLQKFKEVHSLMASHDTMIPDRMAPTQTSPLQWFISCKKTQRLWDQVNGRAVYIMLNPATQVLKLSGISLCFVYLCLEILANKRQARSRILDAANNIKDLYAAPMLFFSTAAFVQAFGLQFTLAPSALIDVLPSSYYAAAFIAVLFEAITFHWNPKIRICTCVGILSISAIAFLKRAPFGYGHTALTKADCQTAGFHMDCQRFPIPVSDIEILEGASAPSTMSIAYVELPGDVTPFRYPVGEEEQAVEQVATLQRAAYSKLASKIVGAERYHRAIHTPGPESEDIEKVQTQVREHALERYQKWLEAAEQKQRQEEQETTEKGEVSRDRVHLEEQADINDRE